MLGIESQKVAIVALFNEDVFPIVATIENLVVLAILERNWFGHGLSPRDLTDFQNLSGLVYHVLADLSRANSRIQQRAEASRPVGTPLPVCRAIVAVS